VKLIFIACKPYVEYFEYLHSWSKKHPKLFFTYAYFFPRMYHAIGFFLVIELMKLFSEKEDYCLRTLGKKLTQLHSFSKELHLVDKAKLDQLNNTLYDATLHELLLRIKTTRDKYFAHLYINRPGFEAIKVSADEIKAVLQIAEKYLRSINHILGEPDESYEVTESELGHLVFERLELWEQYHKV
jgi:hypothetical protein